MSKQTIKDKKRASRKRERLKAYFIIGVSVVGLGAIAWGIIGPSFRPEIGEAAHEMSADHVPEGEDPGPYNTDPPTSGPHYAAELEAGFYDEVALADIGPFPEGYLVHNLEHGYVIFWYNCEILSEAGCIELKTQIQDVMDGERNFKVVAFPRQSIDVPVVMTSWARMLAFDDFNSRLAKQFVKTNRNQAPEPNAP